MANKHSRDFGLSGKGSRPRTDTSSKAFQENYEVILIGCRPCDDNSFTRTGPAKWTKKFK